MKDKDLSVLLKKTDELRALFVLGQRVLPFLEEIFMFVSEIKPLLDDINHSIEENLKKMPNVSKQLSKVTEATELATNEIMDIVDGLFYKTDLISSNIKRMAEIDRKKRDNSIRLLEIIKKAIEKGSDLREILPHLDNSIKNLKTANEKEYQEVNKHNEDILQSIRDDSSSIMMSLQVQDITSQQIAAVNHLLETIQVKLTSIMTKFNSTDVGELVPTKSDYDERINVSHLHRSIAFDPEAVDSLSTKESRQSEVDEFMREHQEGETGDKTADESGEASQDDIDAMFGGAEEEPAAEPEEAQPAAEEDAGEASQNDIDAMFAATQEEKPDEEVTESVKESSETAETKEEESAAEEEDEGDPFENFSQEDIDALFGK
ncbi:MAG: hypothetical protein ACLFQX_08910 [Candidatus Kapaibacterium sp.]